MWKSLQIFGANKREFFVSVTMLLLGFIVMIVAMPPTGFESETPPNYYKNYGAARFALLFVCAVISLLCAINAWRDENASVKEHKRIVIWCGALCLWALVLLMLLFTWWLQSDDVLKASWFHIG
jgi:hypothetical protein